MSKRENEQIEWFKRFAATYLMWSHSNMDRIVRDAVKRNRAALSAAEGRGSDN